jgi:hypothetical protein
MRIGPLLALLPLLWPVIANAGRFTADELRRLDRGEVVTRYWKRAGRDVGTGWAAAVIDAEPGQVFAVVAAVNRYKEFMNRVVESKVVRRTSTGYEFYFKIDMPWPLDDVPCWSTRWSSSPTSRRRTSWSTTWRRSRSRARWRGCGSGCASCGARGSSREAESGWRATYPLARPLPSAAGKQMASYPLSPAVAFRGGKADGELSP